MSLRGPGGRPSAAPLEPLVETSVSAPELLRRLRELGVDLAVAGDRLRVNAPRGVLTPELTGELQRSKGELLALLAGGDRAEPPLAPITRDGPLPLSFAQERLWFLDRLEPGSAAYAIPLAFTLSGRLDVAALEAALADVVARQEAFRARCRERHGQPEIVVERDTQVPFQFLDVAALPAAAREEEVARRAREEAARPFDLAAGPLLRATLLRCAPEEHVVLLTTHHFAADGWSMRLLVGELAACYTARAAGAAPALPPLPLQYADYAVWQRRRLAGDRLAAELEWWRRRLEGCPPLELPTDHPRPRALSGRGARRSFTLEAPLAAALRELARRERTTLFTVILAGFQALLGRYSGQQDLAVATAVSHRPHRDLEGVVGCFLNNLVLRADLSGDPSFRELLARAREVVVAALAHQELPFERLVEELQPRRDLSRHPVFQAMCVLENAPLPEAHLPGLTLRALPLDPGTSRFDLTLSVVDGAAALEGTLELSTDLFTPESGERLTRHLVRLLAGAAADPQCRLSRLPLLGDEERRRVVHLWNATDKEYDRYRPLHRLVEEQARRTPEAVAVELAGATVGYGELVARAARLSHHLRRLGVGPEARVGVLCERALELPVALLATLQAGGAWVPLDPDDPAERLAMVLEDAAPAVLLAQERHAGRLAPTCPVLFLDRLEEEHAGLSGALPAADPPPEGLAYTLFTSGSTGRPKGAMNEHRGIVNRLLWMQEAFGLGPEDRVLHKTPTSFDVSVWELFWPLLAGARLVLAPPGVHRDPAALAHLVAAAGITTIHFVPSMLRAFLEQEAAQLAGCVCLRRAIASGEALSRDLVKRWHATVGAPLFNLYGPTEAAIDVSWRLCPPGEAGGVPIGRPVSNTRLYVLDPHLEPAPPGVPGELAIGGAQVGRGYLGRPGATAERFVPDPFGPPGARLYRTGDLARWLDDGELEYLGRLDHQLKVRGVRIEAGEVEAALRACPEVREAVVEVREAAPGDSRLVAWVVLEDGGRPLPGDLRRRLADRLPEAMVPGGFVCLPRLPTTASGKVDRRALPDPAWGEPAGERSHRPPATPAEEMLAGLWRELLGIVRVGTDDDFFALGGHSLLAARLVARLRRDAGVELPLRAVFEAPVLGALARRLEEEWPDGASAAGASMAGGATARSAVEGVVAGAGRAAEPLPAAATAAPSLDEGSSGAPREEERAGHVARVETIPPVPRDAPLPLSWAQERLWFLDQLDPGSPVYGIPVFLRLRGGLDPRLLEQALERVVARHEVLRTGYREVDGRPLQAVLPAVETPLELADLSGLPPAEREERAAALQAEELEARFDLAAGRVLRARLLRFAEAEHLLLVHLHHVAGDGWSLGILFDDLARCYEALARGAEPLLPPPPVAYADFAGWQRRRLEAGDLAAQLEAWRQRLAGAPDHLDLPLDASRAPVQTTRGERESLLLGAELSRAVRELGRSQGATPFMTLLAAFAVLLSRWSGQEEMVIGAPVADRPRPELEGVVGNFLNTLPLRLDLAGRPSFGELLARVREVALDAFSRQEVPFEAILEALELRRDLCRTPLFQVFFNVLNFPVPRLALPGIEGEAAASPEPPARFDLTLYVAEEAAAVRLDLVYNADLFARQRMAEALRQLHGILEQATADPGRPVAELSLVTPAARPRLPDPAAPLDDTWRGPVPAWLETRAAEAPWHPAVVDTHGAWSYGDFAAAVAELAGQLTAAGLGRGDVVAVLAARSGALPWALLAALRAGAAFVALDPAWPPLRLARCLALARPKAWLAQQEAGPVPVEVTAALDELGVACRIALPPRPSATSPAGREALAPRASPLGTGTPLPPSPDAPSPLPPASEDPWAPRSSPAAVPPTALPPAAAVGPDDLAYLAFTSGSTGDPKAVLGCHRSLTHFLPWLQEHFAFSPEDRFSMLSGLAHDPLHRDLFTPLCLGASVRVPPPAAFEEAGGLARWAAAEGVSVAHLTPALLELLAEVPAGGEPGALPALRWAFVVGDVLTHRHVARLRRLAPSAGCVNLYGATETQRAVAWHPAVEGAPKEEGEMKGERAGEGERGTKEVLPLGRGMPGVQLLVRSASGQLAGIGEVGELWMRSPHLGAGYLDDPELTAARFLANPWTGATDDRLYRTGDLGRYLPDGAVEPLGRADRQVKVRGFRVEPGEVEAALARHPQVREVAVVPVGEGSELRLAACVASAGEAAEPAVLRRFLAERLPDWMLPATWIAVERLPLTANRKVDRRALVALAAEVEAPSRESLAPRDRLELELARLFEEILGRPAGVTEDFFSLGGHSLAAVRLMARIEGAWGTRLPLAALFRAPTVEGLAGVLRSSRARRRPSPLVAIREQGEGLPFACVHAAGGTVLCYQELARRLPGRPFWALEAPGIDGAEPPVASVEALAERYLTALRERRPAGPYLLGGWSFGGLVAYEMARRLADAGEEVPVLALIDSWPPGALGPFEAADDEATVLGLMGRALGEMTGTELTLAAEELRELPDRETRIAHLIAAGRRAGALPPDVGPAQVAPLVGVVEAHLAARRRYDPEPFPGRAVLFRAAAYLADGRGGDPSRTLGWERWVQGGVTVEVVPGDHYSMLAPPEVETLAARLAPLLGLGS